MAIRVGREALVVVAVLAVHAAIVAGVALRSSATFDEPAHLGAGFAALTEHDLRFDPEAGLVAPVACALPLVLTGEPALDATTPAHVAGRSYDVGRELLFG